MKQTKPKDERGAMFRVNSHFAVNIDDGVGYSYIRKNACSVFKRMIVETSQYRAQHSELADNPMRFMGRFHRISATDLKKMPKRVIVLRNPLERIVSGFVSQFVLRLERRTEGMHGDIEARMGQPAERITFESFVDEYLSLPRSEINVHFVDQYLHLAPINYSHALHIDSLLTDAEQVFGREVAARFFTRQINSTSRLESRTGQEASHISAKEIQDYYRDSGKVPGKSDFLTDRIAATLSSLYANDIKLWNASLEARRANGGKIMPLDAAKYIS